MLGIGLMMFGIGLVCVYVGFESNHYAQVTCLAGMLVMFMFNMLLQVAPCLQGEQGYLIKLIYYLCTVAVLVGLTLYWFFGIAS
jgi:hypothetical protein